MSLDNTGTQLGLFTKGLLPAVSGFCSLNTKNKITNFDSKFGIRAILSVYHYKTPRQKATQVLLRQYLVILQMVFTVHTGTLFTCICSIF